VNGKSVLKTQGFLSGHQFVEIGGADKFEFSSQERPNAAVSKWLQIFVKQAKMKQITLLYSPSSSHLMCEVGENSSNGFNFCHM
jgi:hypothetical protein